MDRRQTLPPAGQGVHYATTPTRTANIGRREAVEGIHDRPDQGVRIQAENGVVHMSLINIGPKAVFYQYKTSNNKTMRLFAIKTSDGEYRVAQNACDACYRKKMGYRQEGADLVCNSCLRRTPSASVDTTTDDCAPRGIPRRIEGKALSITAAELEARADLF
jgi:uncharacterized membrane protein